MIVNINISVNKNDQKLLNHAHNILFYYNNIDTNLLLKAFNSAVTVRNPGKDLIFHSDRRIQYCSKRFRNSLKSYRFKQSISRKGNCWDNACAESFFKNLKTEWLYDNNYETRELAKRDLFE